MKNLPPLPGLTGIPNAATPTPTVFPPADERKLLSAFIYAEAEPNQEDMRRVLGTAVNRARIKGQNVFDIIAAPNQYVPGLPEQQKAKFLPYLRGEIKNPIELRATLMAENLADEFLAGKFTPPTSETAYRGREGKNVYPPEMQKETHWPTGNALNMASLPGLSGPIKKKEAPMESQPPKTAPAPEQKKEVKVIVEHESPFALIGKLFDKIASLW